MRKKNKLLTSDMKQTISNSTTMEHTRQLNTELQNMVIQINNKQQEVTSTKIGINNNQQLVIKIGVHQLADLNPCMDTPQPIGTMQELNPNINNKSMPRHHLSNNGNRAGITQFLSSNMAHHHLSNSTAPLSIRRTKTTPLVIGTIKCFSDVFCMSIRQFFGLP